MKKTSYSYLILIVSILSSTNLVYATEESPAIENSKISSPSKSEKSYPEGRENKNIQLSEISTLKSFIDDQKEKNQSLQNKINIIENSSGLNFAVWTGIILASVAVLLTILGITIAFFSFFGYKKVMSSAKVAATNISTVQASEVTERLAPELTERVLLKLIEGGNFDVIIQQAVEKVTYRGIEFSSSDMLDDKEKQ